jgi:N-dimethylarginine dimethylaminohydrolase
MKLFVNDETSSLRAVVLGVADSFGGTPSLNETYDPKSKEHIVAGTFPVEADLKQEMDGVESVLLKYNVNVLRPEILQDTNQVFARDIGFVIEDKFVVPNIISDRVHEQDGITFLTKQMSDDQIVEMPKGAFAEGGDVMPWKGRLYVGYSEEEDYNHYKVSRTNKAGVEFLSNQFPNLEVIGIELNKSDTNPRENALHLDCCFQPIGLDQCIIYKGGFKNESDYEMMIDHFGSDNCILIDKDEMYNMCSNVFSISSKVIISEVNFIRLNDELERRGFTVEKVKYAEVAKMEGLLRCSTLPLEREL